MHYEGRVMDYDEATWTELNGTLITVEMNEPYEVYVDPDEKLIRILAGTAWECVYVSTVETLESEKE